MKAIRLQRFKCFLDSGWIKIRPLTILFGYNSSGKSSILNALLMLKQSLENPSPEVPLIFSAEKGIDIGSFEDAVYNHKVNHDEPMVISLRVDIGEKIERNSIINPNDIEYSISISYNQKRRFITVLGFTLNDRTGKVILSMKKANPAQNAKEQFYSDFTKSRSLLNLKIDWYNFLPIIKSSDDELIDIKMVTEAVREKLINSFKSLSNVGPVRAIPERNQSFTGVSPTNVGVHGEEALKLLYLDRFREKPVGLDKKVNNFLSKYNYKFEWRIFKNSLGQFMLIDTRTKIKVSIKDVGFGLSQILPIIIQVYNAMKNSTVIIEQPEIHLHSRAQSELADVFIDSINDDKDKFNKKQLLIETHSEQILLRIRKKLAETYLNRSDSDSLYRDLAIYFVENNEGTSRSQEIILNEMGELVEAPNSFRQFFSDDFEEAMKINSLLSEIKSQK